MSGYAINGFLFSQRRTGVMRFVQEIIKELDKIIEPNELEIVIPEYVDNMIQLENIRITKYGKVKGSLWEQTDFLKYLIIEKKESINFNNTFPILKPGIIMIHDIAYKIHPEFGTSIHGKISNIYHRIIFRIASKNKVPVITVSYFSKYQLIDEYKIAPKRITVIGSAWQHYQYIDTDDSIIEKYHLISGEYYFSLGSLSKMKNTRWILEIAKSRFSFCFGR